MLYTVTNPQQYCSWCKTLQCLPNTGLWSCEDTGASVPCSATTDAATGTVQTITCTESGFQKNVVSYGVHYSSGDTGPLAQLCADVCPPYCATTHN